MRQGWLRVIGGLAMVLVLASAGRSEENEPQTAAGSSPAGGSSTSADSAAAQDDERLVAIGSLAGAHLYTTYGYIGMVIDAHRQGTYTDQRVQELMTEVINLGQANSRQLKKVRNGNLVDSDKKVIDDFLSAYELLAEEANAAIEYSRTDSSEDLAHYHQSRTAAWRKIKTILGIKKP